MMKPAELVPSNQLVDPYKGTVIATYPLESFTSADAKIRSAKAAQQRWQQLPFRKRRELYLDALATIEKNLDTYAARMTQEMFKPLRHAQGELESGVAKLKRIADLAEAALQDRPVAANGAAFEFHIQRVAKGGHLYDRALELSLLHRAQQHWPGAACGQCGGAETRLNAGNRRTV